MLMKTLKLILIASLFVVSGYAQGHLQVVLPPSAEPAAATEENDDYLKVNEVHTEGHLQVVEPVGTTEDTNTMEISSDCYPQKEESAVIEEIKVNPYENDEVFITRDRPPRFPGGEQLMWRFIGDSMQYPEEALENNIQGQVSVKFVVRRSGNITDVQMGRSIHPLLDEEAMRIIRSMPRWIPASFQGRAVSSSEELFINFRIR